MGERLKEFLRRHRLLIAPIRRALSVKAKLCRAREPFVRSKVIRSYLESNQVRKLQIGAGPNTLKGWLNTDFCLTSFRHVFLDATKPFPFADRTFDYVFSEHQIEHLTYKQGLFMLRECYRVLKLGGRMRIATPDLETLIGLHTPVKSNLQQRYINWITDTFLPDVGVYSATFVINNAFRNFGHQFLYDRVTLQSAVEKAGFVDVIFYAPGESEDPILRGIESHGKAAGNEEINRFETMVLEAIRPT